MSTVVAFRHSDAHYLLAQKETSLAWQTNASVEFLGEVDTDFFGPSAASAIDLQIATRRFAMVSKEHFYFSIANAPVGMAPERMSPILQVAQGESA